MRRLRPYIAVAVVTAALCADRAAQAAPALRPEMTQLAERLVARLTIGFSRSTLCLRILAPRSQQPPQPMLAVPRVAQAEPRPLRPLLSPIQFSLPPPHAA